MDFKKYFLDAPEDLNIVNGTEEFKLLKLYAYNAYFNADPTYTEKVNDGCFFTRNKDSGIDGVYINESLDEDTVECLRIYYVGESVFSLSEVLNIVDKIGASVADVNKGIYRTPQDNALRECLDELDNKKVIIRIITDYVCSDEEKHKIINKVEKHDVSTSGLDVQATIQFSDDIVDVFESNIAPFDYVPEGKLLIDDHNNVLKYKNNSFICNISAKSLKKIWKSDGNRGLLAMNLRYYVKSKNIDEKIEDSIMLNGNNFWYLNNGIIIVCDDYNIVKNELRLKNFSIVNGGQTTRMIGTTPFDNDFYISCKVVKNIFENVNQKNEFVSNVAEASNTQKPIKSKDIIANRIEQRNLKSMMQENNVFVEIKRGDKCFKEKYPEAWQRTKNNEIAQDLYSFIYMEPGPARNGVSKILENNEKYNIIFKNHVYNFDFLRDVLFLDKSFRSYQKKISKLENGDVSIANKQGLVKNGMYYFLATIGYILKLIYNPEFKANMHQYRNQETKYELFSSELAFMHGFIDRKLSYNEFEKDAFELFDSIYQNLILSQFNIARSLNQSLAYSNWCKTNTGFNEIRKQINVITFDNKQNYILDLVSKHFVKIDKNQENKNIDNYVDYCKNNKKIKSKDFNGFVLSENDKGLRDELLIYRLNKANEKHVLENKLFTDKMLDKIVYEKPVTLAELKKIISAATVVNCGNDILSIVFKYL